MSADRACLFVLFRTFYCCADKASRDAAHRFLLQFRAEAVASLRLLSPLLQLLRESREPHTIVFACATLREILAAKWSELNPKDTLEIRRIPNPHRFLFLHINLIVAVLGDVSFSILFEYVRAGLSSYVISATIRMLSSITRLGWLTDLQHRTVMQSVSPLMKV